LLAALDRYRVLLDKFKTKVKHLARQGEKQADHYQLGC
jgi:hypothetical protein